MYRKQCCRLLQWLFIGLTDLWEIHADPPNLLVGPSLWRIILVEDHQRNRYCGNPGDCCPGLPGLVFTLTENELERSTIL